jgi:hypothetical protein
MPSTLAIERVQQQVIFWEKNILEERDREFQSELPSILLPRLLDGLSRSEARLKKLQGK